MAKSNKQWQSLASGEAAIGVDVGDKWSHICVILDDGEVVEETRIRTSGQAFERFFRRRDPARVALEAGNHSHWIERLLKDCGHEAIVANVRNLQLISRNDKKNDRTDAELLARLARVDPVLLAPIQHREEAQQVDMCLITARDALVRARSMLVNYMRGVIKPFGLRIPKCSSAAFPKVGREILPVELKEALWSVFDQIDSLTSEIREYDKKIESVTRERYPHVELLRQVKGVGPITGLAFALVIGDPTRFKSSRAVGSYLGLRPRQDDSGDSSPELRITKAGNSYLRSMLVQSAQYILGPLCKRHGYDSDLRRWGLALADRGKKNAKKRAVVAVARKLAVLLHRLWITGEEYEPLRMATRRMSKAA